jgi:integrase
LTRPFDPAYLLGVMKPKKTSTASGEFRRVAEGLYVYEQSGAYYARFRHKGTRIFERLGTDKKPCTTLPEARRLLRAKKDELEKVNHDVRKMTLHQAIEAYRSVMKGASGTKTYKTDYLDKFKKAFKANVKVSEITTHDLRLFLKKFEDLSAPTRNHIITVMREVFASAVEKRIISADASPMNPIKFFKVGDKVKRITPSYDQFLAIVESIRSQKLADTAQVSADLVEFMGHAGLGQAECDGLCWQDIHLGEPGHITVIRQKTKKQFSIPLYPTLRPLLERLNEARPNKDPKEKVFSVRNPKKALESACKRLHYPAFTARSLRRMFITTARRNGVPVQHVAKWQGHRDVKMILKVYHEATDDESMRLAALMMPKSSAVPTGMDQKHEPGPVT